MRHYQYDPKFDLSIQQESPVQVQTGRSFDARHSALEIQSDPFFGQMMQAAPASNPTSRTELIFIEDNVKDINTLLQGIASGKEVHILDSTKNGLIQIAEILAGRTGIDALHLLSYGKEASINLGSLILDQSNLQSHAAELNAIGASLSPDADILLYGCHIGANTGKNFTDQFAALTAADVASSNDLTGSKIFHANWDLEVQHGNIETAAVVDANLSALYSGVLDLASATISFTAGSNFVSYGHRTNASGNIIYNVNGNPDYQLKIDGASQGVYEYTNVGQYALLDANITGETSVTLSFAGGNLFTANSISVENYIPAFAAQDLVFKAYDASNNPVGTTKTFTTSTGSTTNGGQKDFIDFSASGFVNIAYLKITATTNGNTIHYLAIDNLSLSNIHALNAAPTITGATASQAVNDNSTILPFSGVTIGDADSSDTQSVSVQLDTAAKGSFTTLNGFTNAGGGNYTFSGTAAAATTAIRGLVFTPTANRVNPTLTETTTFTISTNDGTASTVTNNTTTVVSTSINDTPSVGGATAVTNINDNATATPFSAFTISDADTAQTQSISVTLDTAAKGSFTTLNGFTNAGGGVYTFSGTAAAAQTAIRGLVFTPAANRVAVGNTETTTFTVSVDDGIATAVTNNSTTVVSTSVNNAPTLGGATAVTNINDNATATPFSSFTVADVDNPAQTLTVSVTLDTASKGSFTTLNGFSDAGGGVYTFTGTAAATQTAIRGLVFTPTLNHVAPTTTETTTFTVSVDDGIATAVTNSTTTVVTTSVNDAPTITGATAGQAVNDNATVSPFSGVTIGDVDSPAQTQSVSVTLDTAAKGSFTTLNGFTDAGSGVYTFSGTAAAATTAIRGLVFTPTANRVNPNLTETTTFTISSNDGIATAVTNSTTTVVSTSINNAPSIGGATAVTNINDNATATPFSAFTISDADAAQTQSVSVTLDTAAKGSFTTLNGFTNAGGGVYTFSGTAAAAQTAIRGLVFTPTANHVAAGNTETTTFTVSVNDGIATAVTNNTTTVVATSVNDAPTGADHTATTTEDIAYTITASDFGFADVDFGASLDSVTITSLPAQGTLKLNNSDVTLSQSITKADIDAGKLVFTPAANANGSGYDSIGFKVSDGNALSAVAKTLTFDVTAANDAPVWTNLDATPSYIGGTAAISLDTNAAISDVELSALNNFAGSVLTLARHGGANSTDVFSKSGTLDLTAGIVSVGAVAIGTYTNASGSLVITFNGFATNTLVNQAITQIQYSNSNVNASGNVQIDYSFNDGSGAGNATTVGHVTVTLVPPNSAPTGSVTITGTAREGKTLSVTNNLADADGLGTISYIWKADGNTIGGATGNTLLLTQAQVGKVITAVASYTDLRDTLESVSSAPTSAVADNALPSSSNKTVTMNEDTSLTLALANFGFSDSDSGDTLQAVKIISLPAQGALTLNGNSVAENQSISAVDILANRLVFTPVANANGNAYANIGFKVSDGIDLSSNSANLTVNVIDVNDPPTGGVTISGKLTVGQVLTASNNLVDPDGLGPITYIWKANGVTIRSEYLSTYTLRSTDFGKTISVSAVYTDLHGNNESISSAATGPIQNDNHAPTGAVTWSGINRQGETLTASNTLADVDGMGVVSYQWRANGVDINGATGATINLSQNEVGKYISVAAIYTDQLGNAERVNSGSTPLVTNINDAPTGTVMLTGQAKVGQVLSINSTVNDLDGMGTVYYLWMADGVKIKGASSPTYTIKSSDLGKAITVKIYYTDLYNTEESVTSAPSAIVTPQTGLVGLINTNPLLFTNMMAPAPLLQPSADDSLFHAQSFGMSQASHTLSENISEHHAIFDSQNSLLELIAVPHLNGVMM